LFLKLYIHPKFILNVFLNSEDSVHAFKLLLYWQGEVPTFLKHMSSANFQIICSFSSSLLSELQQSSTANHFTFIIKVLSAISE